jgi:hypothetical protein
VPFTPHSALPGPGESELPLLPPHATTTPTSTTATALETRMPAS